MTHCPSDGGRTHLSNEKRFLMQMARDLGADPQNVVSEIYSPPRVTDAARRLNLGIAPGFAFDLTTVDENGKTWDFDDASRRTEARRRLREQRPMFLIGSPMCTAFSTWQFLNAQRRDAGIVHREWVRAMVHLRFVCELYQEQIDAGRYFLHEHPAGATSWSEKCIRDLLVQPNVEAVTSDRCQYGQEDSRSGDPVKKPTSWLSNSEAIRDALRDALQVRCTGRGGACSRPRGGAHRVAEGRVCKESAVYPFQLCKAILMGCRRQLVIDGRLTIGICGIQRPEEEMTYEQLCKVIERKGIFENESELLAVRKARQSSATRSRASRWRAAWSARPGKRSSSTLRQRMSGGRSRGPRHCKDKGSHPSQSSGWT